MNKTESMLMNIAAITKVELCVIEEGKAENVLTGEKLSMDNGTIRSRIATILSGKSYPVIIIDDNNVFFACLKEKDTCFLLGPVCVRPLSGSELRKHYRLHHINPHIGHDPKVMAFTDFLNLISLISCTIGGKSYNHSELLALNNLPESLLLPNRHEQILFDLSADEDASYHHTYMDEQSLLSCVREGRTDDALMHTMTLDTQIGRMSKKEYSHWTKLCAVSITLCTRAAIEGGLTPAQAYRISDFYMQKMDACQSIPSLISCRNQAITDLTDRVASKQNNIRTSSYVEKCRDYVSKNYMNKIKIGTIADSLGINESYLSRIFSRETGNRFQDYVNIVRTDRAANLLTYSEEPLAHIAEYVGFPSQSYFGKIFLRFKGMTPRQYREKHKPLEFTSITQS